MPVGFGCAPTADGLGEGVQLGGEELAVRHGAFEGVATRLSSKERGLDGRELVLGQRRVGRVVLQDSSH